MTQLEEVQSTAKANRIPGKLRRRTLASIIAVGTMVFAIPPHAQTLQASETGAVRSFRQETTSKQNRETKMTLATKSQATTSAEDTSIRPFHINIPEEQLVDLENASEKIEYRFIN